MLEDLYPRFILCMVHTKKQKEHVQVKARYSGLDRSDRENKSSHVRTWCCVEVKPSDALVGFKSFETVDEQRWMRSA